MTKQSRTSGILALSLVMALALSACGSVSTAAIADQANTSASFAAEDISTDQFNVAMTTFAASFAASFAEDASAALSASFEDMSESLSADVDIYGSAYDSAHVAGEAAGKLAASVEGAANDAYQVAYAETFSVAYGEAYAAEYDSAMRGVASAAIDDLASGLNADIAELEGAALSADLASDDAGSGEANVQIGDSNMLGASFEDALDDALSAASAQVDPGASASGTPTTTLNTWVAVIIVLVIGGGVWLKRFNKQNI